MVNLSTTVTGTPTYNSGNAKFGSYGLSGGAIAGTNVDNFFSSTGADGGSLTTGTVEAWVKATTAGALKVISSHAGWYYLAMDASGKAYGEYGWGAGSSTGLTGTTTIGDGNWHHVALVITSGAGSLYVDGSREATSATTRFAVGYNGSGFTVGTHTNNSSGFLWPGSIDEVRVSNVARYTGTTYTTPTAAFTRDASTVGLYHLENNGNADPYLLSSALSGSGSLVSALTHRTNLMPYPSVETTVGWAGKTGTTTLSDPLHYIGTKGVFFQRTTTSGLISGVFGTTNSSDPNSDSIPVVAGDTYTFSAYVYGWTNLPTVEALLIFQTATVFHSFVAGTSVVTTGAWTRLSVTATVPSGATKMGVEIRSAGGASVAANTSFAADAFLIEKSASVRGYFDGSTANAGYNYAWTGTANASTSVESFGRTNLMKHPSAETATNDWTVMADRAVTVDSSQSYVGSKSFKIANVNAAFIYGRYGATSLSAPNSASIPAVAGQTYTFSAYLRGGLGSPTMMLALIWETDTAFISASTAGTSAVVTGGWTRYSVTATAPATTTKMGLEIRSAASESAGFYIFADAILVEQAGSVGTYFDGSTVNTGYTYAWSGTAHESTSTEVLGSSSGIASALSGSGTLTTAFTNYQKISSALSGSGALTSALHRYISSNLSGSGTLTSTLGLFINTQLSGSGTLTSNLHRYISSALSGSGTLTSQLSNYQRIQSPLSGSGTLGSVLTSHHILSVLSGSGVLSSALVVSSNHIDSFFYGDGNLFSSLSYRPHIISHLSGQGFLFSELGYVVLPSELGTAPLGKLVSYTVGTSAVPLNPAEGSGSAPTVGGTYLKGLDPELALGELNVLTAGNIGTYEGEIVNLSMDKASANVRVSMSTPLTLLNTEMALFPFIDAAESTWTAVRAIDYWTQQCGLFYDKVPGAVVAYASAYGHNNSYAAGTTKHFYERLTGGSTATTVVNERSVKTFGFNTTATTAFHENADTTVPLTLLNHQKLLFSIGMGIRGTGRTATVNWEFLDTEEQVHTLKISGTSAGLITATVDDVLVDSTTVAADANYRIVASIENLGTAKIGKLSVHTDDLAGNGTEIYMGTSRVLAVHLPSVLRLRQITHVSSGGSGSLMLRWGTYLTVDKAHPQGVPAVQKTLVESNKPRLFVSGFEGNVWNMLNEFCSIARLDVRFLGESLYVGPRLSALTAPDGNFSGFQYSSERRDKYKQVAVVNQQSKADTTDTALLWRADSVYQVAAREIFETTVQTDHSILNVVNPVAVLGISPYPYKSGGGQYVVTGADGYIISPAWWNDNGGKVEVSLTGKSGEIALKITAPTIDTVRAPYRISEGEADRPALYISGSGILNEPKEVHVGTGAKNAKEGFDTVFESPFVSGVVETYDTAMAMASEYSAHNAEVEFEIPNDFDKPSRFGQFPAGTIFTDNVRNYRIGNVSQTNSKVSGTAATHTTIGAYVDSFPEGATLADAKARHFGKSIRQFNITPLRGTSA